MAYDPNFPPANAELISAEFRNQFQGLKALIDALQAQVNGLFPVGLVVGWDKNRANMPTLPGTWVECNGQVLNDPESPFHGQTMEDLNGAVGGVKRFLRGASASGGTGGSDSHFHTTMQDAGINGDNNAGIYSIVSGTTSIESLLPSYYEVVWVMRIK